MAVRHYVLEGRNVVTCDNLMVWARWMEINNRIVAQTEAQGIRVSTVFLGVDHALGVGLANPLLFETMVFLPGGNEDCIRASTLADAEGHHRIMCMKYHVQLQGRSP